jgi:benzoate membrane transport protein
MLAGVLLRFGLDAFVAMKTQLGLALAMFAAYLVGRRLWARYAVVGVLAVGVAIAAAKGLLGVSALTFEVTRPVWTTPTFSLAALVGVAVPLFAVTMASQNVPGVAVMRAAGYGAAPVSPLIGWTGLTTVLLAPFGGYAFNLAAITAAICMGREAHEDPARRYVAAVAAGAFYLVMGVFGATVGALFAAFPRELVMAVAGLALVNTIANGLVAAVQDETRREAALITFLVTASGVSLFGIGAAFWGLVAGLVGLLVLRPR